MSEALNIEEFDIEENPVREAFKVDDDQKADWAMRKLAQVRNKQLSNKSIFDRELNRITEWLSRVNSALENDSAYFEAVLIPYALSERSNGRKSVVLPHGTVKTTSVRAKVEVEDEIKFIEWAKINSPTLVRVHHALAKKELNERITDDNQVVSTEGEIIPNVRVLPASTSVSFVIEEKK